MFTRSTSIVKGHPTDNLNLNSFEFFEALSKNDVEKVKSFFYDPSLKIWELKDENNFTALHFSVLKNNYDLTLFIIEEVKKRLGMGANQKLANFINEKNKEGITALHYAVSNGNIKMVQMLKQFGANLEAITNIGKNIMHIAAGSNQPSMLIYFFLNEAQDITSIDENGSTPLHWACYYNAIESANYLMSLNVDVNAQDKEKFTPLHLAVSNNSISLVKLLLRKGADKNIININNELPIDIARKQNYTEIVKILTNKDYNPLCTLEMPYEYIKPTDFYRRIILLMIIIPEIITIILVIPFLDSNIYFFMNLVTFGLCLLNYFFLLGKEPGYQKNTTLLKECGGESDNKPLKKLLEDECDLKNYCPTCFVLKGIDKKHCFICNKCVLEMSHHCFWLNKCIGKKNKIIYVIFAICAFIYSFCCLFICLNLLFDTVNNSYKLSVLSFDLYIDRGFRVLGAGIVTLFSTIITFPLFFLYMIELFKSCGCLGNKKSKALIEEKVEDNNENIINEGNHVELINQVDEPLLNDDQKDNNSEEKNIKIKIPKENFPIVDDRPSNAE